MCLHTYICTGVCANVWALQSWEAIQGLHEMERMRISALVSLAKAFWGPPSHLVEYLYLDHVGVNTQARKTFSFRKISMTFLRGKEERQKGRENGRIKVCVPFCRGSEAQKEQGICPRLPVGGIAGEDQGQGLDLQAWDGISARWLG